VQQLFQVVSSVCFDFVPSRGSPEDNKVWLTLTFSQRVVFVSIRNNNGKVVSSVCFDFVPGRGSPEDNKGRLESFDFGRSSDFGKSSRHLIRALVSLELKLGQVIGHANHS
jgi:hypothetical protein